MMILRFVFQILVIFWCAARVQAQAVAPGSAPDSSARFSSKWHFGVQGGVARRLFRPGRIADRATEKYIDDLKNGFSVGARAAYYVWPKIGFGIVADHYQGNAKAADGFSEQVTIQHFSGSVNYRTLLNKNERTTLTSSFYTGYQPYRNRTGLAGQTSRLSGKTMGWGISVSIDHRISRHIVLGLTGSATMGAIYRMRRMTEFSTETLHLSKDDQVDLSRASVTFAVSFM